MIEEGRLHHVGLGEVPAGCQEAELRGGTLSERPVCLHVVHLPAGLLPLRAGLQQHQRRLVQSITALLDFLWFSKDSSGASSIFRGVEDVGV